VGPARPGDDARDIWPARQPAHGQFEQGMPAPGNEGIECVDDAPVAFIDKFIGMARRASGQPRAYRERLIVFVLASQQAARQRKIRQQAHAVLDHDRQTVFFQFALQQAVVVLGGDERRQAMMPRHRDRLLELRRGWVGPADGADFSGFLKIVECAQGLLDRRLRIGPVQLIKVDPIGLQPPQARFERLHDIAPRRAAQLSGIVHDQTKLGRQYDILAARAQNFAQNFFRAASVAVDIGSVDQRNAEIERAVNDWTRGFEIGAAAEIVGAEADEGNLDARIAKLAFLHSWRQPLTLNAAIAAMLTSCASLADSGTICSERSRPTSIGPITVAPPSSISILVEIEAEWNAGMISTLAGPDSRQKGKGPGHPMYSATPAAISPSYSKSTRRSSSSRTASCTRSERSPGGWPKVENASNASRGS